MRIPDPLLPRWREIIASILIIVVKIVAALL